LNDNDIRLITYVPDHVLTALIAGVGPDKLIFAGESARATVDEF